ncbi:MAG TPA: type II CAAX endopeptidase family protein [Ktedonobacterales bacterium]|nr:type II CAAX endopeptidase family protein [Ktedonobacterales bacterium]
MNASASSKRTPLTFFVLIFALSLPFWLIGALAEHFSLELPFNLPVSALMFVCPSIAAFLLVYREEKLGGIGRLLKSVFDVKRIKHKIWYAPVMLLMPVIMALSYGVMLLLGRPLPKPSIPWSTAPILFVVFFLAAAGEEIGWMGYAIDPLQDRWSAFQSGMILGMVWAIWHVVPDMQAHHTLTWIAWQFFFTVMARVLIVWLYNNTGKSALSAILFHTMINVSYALFPNNGSQYDPTIVGTLTATAVVIVTFFWGSKTLARYRYAVE